MPLFAAGGREVVAEAPFLPFLKPPSLAGEGQLVHSVPGGCHALGSRSKPAPSCTNLQEIIRMPFRLKGENEINS